MELLLFYFLSLPGIICCQEVIKMRVREDEDVILPCSLDSTDIRTETFKWKKDYQKSVFLYAAGSHYNNGRSGQDPQFKGRVFHFEDQLQSGNASIVIRNTTKTDSGSYSCIFPFHQPMIRSIIELIVGPRMQMIVKEGEDVILFDYLRNMDLRSETFEWKKGRKNVFQYSAGNHSNNGRPGQDPQFKGRVFHFEDQLQFGNASIVIRNTKMADSGMYSCLGLSLHDWFGANTIELIVDCILKDRTEEKIEGELVTVMRVKEDENVILPCSLDSTNIRTDLFDWKKDDQNVFQYNAGSHYNNGRSGQDPQFKGRVFHFEDQLQSGNASIVIRKTKKTDSGNYRCIFPFHQQRIRSIIELHVDCILKDRTEEKIAGELVTVMRVKEDEDVILPCSLDSTNIRTETFKWKKDDQKEVFFYSAGSHYNNGRSGQDPQFKGRVFHFEDQLQSGNASIVIRKTKVTDSGSYSCIFPFHQPKIRSIIELIVGRGGWY